jgi:hypothetical protein
MPVRLHRHHKMKNERVESVHVLLMLFCSSVNSKLLAHSLFIRIDHVSRNHLRQRSELDAVMECPG